MADLATADSVSSFELKTAPADYRFPTTNQTRHCFTRYIEFHRCVAAKGEDATDCQKFSKYYRSLCPGEWRNGTSKGRMGRFQDPCRRRARIMCRLFS
ncbi:Cytochrome c oxidase subunit 6b-3 [Linum grandiflorum]